MTIVAYITSSGDDGLNRYEQNPESGQLSLLERLEVKGSPSALTLHPTQRFLYLSVRGARAIITFEVDPSDGGLSEIGRRALDADSCYVSTDREGRYLLSAYYGAGKAMVHRIDEDGTVGESVSEVETAPHAHCILTDPSNRFAFLPHTLPANRIECFDFDEQSGALTHNHERSIDGEEGAGPRHYIYHPNGRWVFCANENGSSATSYGFDADSGFLTPVQTLSTLPADFDGENTCAQIHLHPSGRYLYVSNRGHDSIAIFGVDSESGRLEAREQQPTEPTPRVFNLDPAGRFLYAAGQGSGQLASYRIEEETGLLQPLETFHVGKQPMWVELIDLESA